MCEFEEIERLLDEDAEVKSDEAEEEVEESTEDSVDAEGGDDDAVSEEDDSEDEDEGLEIVISTAQKVEKDVMDTPVPVTVFTQDKLTEYGINNYIDLSQMVPM